jgi:hypothetical protein
MKDAGERALPLTEYCINIQYRIDQPANESGADCGIARRRLMGV